MPNPIEPIEPKGPLYKAGTIIRDPEGKDRYKIVRDIHIGETMQSAQFIDLESGEPPVTGTVAPEWMIDSTWGLRIRPECLVPPNDQS